MVEQLALDGFVLVLERLVRVVEVDLLDELSEKILVEIGAELVGQLTKN